MRDDAAPGPLTPASAPSGVPAKSQISWGGLAPGRLGRVDARTLEGRDPQARRLARAVAMEFLTLSTMPVTRRLSCHHAGRSGLICGPMETSTRWNGHSESVPRTATGLTGTPACSAK